MKVFPATRVVFLLTLILLVALALVAAGCKGARYGWQSTAAPPTPSGVDTSVSVGDVTPTPGNGGATETPNGNGNGGDLVAQGQALAQGNGCLGCHTTDGAPATGPTWRGLFGSTETLTDGSTVQVDADYLHESIVDPNAKVVQGFSSGIMPDIYGNSLSDSEIEAIIAYIESLQ